MLLKRHACRFLHPRQPKNYTNFIWISDELLHDVYQCFFLSRAARRYGSSVPGPLEAQRRAAKRRMMYLAKTGGGGGAIDAALLPGLDSRRDLYAWKWLAPASPPKVPKTTRNEGKISPGALENNSKVTVLTVKE